MKAFQLSGYKADPALVEVETPRPGPNEVLVRVASAALNPLDVKLQSGAMQNYFPLTFPASVGTDLSGTVETLGAEVTGWTIGDRIVARTAPTSGGAIAEFALVPADQLVKLPDAVGFDDAAGLPTAAGTAWQALFEVADLKAGQTVLIHAGAGGVGSFAIQFARAAGARVIATASGDGVAIAQRLGADVVIDYHHENFATRVSDPDVVLDTIGGDTQVRFVRRAARGRHPRLHGVAARRGDGQGAQHPRRLRLPFLGRGPARDRGGQGGARNTRAD